jgi:hypothetical protein
MLQLRGDGSQVVGGVLDLCPLPKQRLGEHGDYGLRYGRKPRHVSEDIDLVSGGPGPPFFNLQKMSTAEKVSTIHLLLIL